MHEKSYTEINLGEDFVGQHIRWIAKRHHQHGVARLHDSPWHEPS